MNIRSRLQRKMSDFNERFVSISGRTFKRGTRLEFRAIHPKFGLLMSGWFIADSNNPLVRHIEWPDA